MIQTELLFTTTGSTEGFPRGLGVNNLTEELCDYPFVSQVRQLNYLNLFSGGDVGRQAVKELELPVTNWFSAEVNPYAIQVANDNHPDIQQIGDVTKINLKDLPKIDVLLGGSPCQGFSASGNRLNFDHPESKLFFDFIRIKEELKPRYTMLENVDMRRDWRDIITQYVKLPVYKLNSSIVSPQNRWRLYWTNIDFSMPKDRHVYLKDIVECGCVDKEKSYCLTKDQWRGGDLEKVYDRNRSQMNLDFAESVDNNCHQFGEAKLNGHDILKRVYDLDGKCPTLNTCGGGNREPKVACGAFRGRIDGTGNVGIGTAYNQVLEVRPDDKTNTLTTVQKDNVVVYPDKNKWRKLTVKEACRLQTLPDDYCKAVSNSQAYKILGNGWTNEIIKSILGGLRE